MANAYFCVVHKDDGTYLKLIPATDGGEDMTIHEIMDYLDARDIEFNLKVINNALSNLSSEAECKLTGTKYPPVRENYSMKITDDKMQVILRFYPAAEGGEKMSIEEVVNDLKLKGIRFGVQSSNLQEYFMHRMYMTDVIAAQGSNPRAGKDAEIEYMFDTDRKAKPTLLEDGSVDFFSLNTICPVKEGDLLAQLTPADPGAEGRSVYGEIVKPRLVRSKRLQYGRNIRISEDNLKIYSMVSGHVTLATEKVFVTDIMEFEDIDTSTGNIDFDGNILIRGNVKTGFKVKASGDIQINGVVEGAIVESGGNISIARGMNGMSRGELHAKGNVIAKFLENASVYAGGFVSTESILHSKVQAGTEVDVTGRKGFITGGSVMASNQIAVKTLGSNMGASTVVEVGVNPALKREQFSLQKQKAEVEKNLASIEPVLAAMIMKKTKGIALSEAQVEQMQKMAALRKIKKDELLTIDERMQELNEILVEAENPRILVTGDVYPGTRINILDVSLTIKSATSYCRFVRKQGDVKMEAL